MRSLIAGAGIVGVATAHALLNAGGVVDLVDPGVTPSSVARF